MVDKIKDGFGGGEYVSGAVFEMFAPTPENGRLGVTGKFNALVDEVGDLTLLTTDNKVSIVNAINEIDINTDNSIKLDSTPQTLIGDYTFGVSTGLSNTITFNHDVEFQGSVLFSGGSGDVLDIDNTFISLGDDASLTPVGDGGIILERGSGITDVRIYWDESALEWKIKPSDANIYTLLHTGNIQNNALNFIQNDDLVADDFSVQSTNPFIRLNKTSGSVDAKLWDIKFSSVSDDLTLIGLSDDGLTTYEAYRINRSGSLITGHSFFVDNLVRFQLTDSIAEFNVPIKVDSIVEDTTNNGVLIDTLTIKDEGFLNGSTRLLNLLSSGSVFNPSSQSLNFTINGNGGEAFFINSNTSKIFNRYETSFDNGILVDDIYQLTPSNGINFNDMSYFNDDVYFQSNQPTIYLNEQDQTADNKLWAIRSAGSFFSIGSALDNLSFSNAYTLQKFLGKTIQHRFYTNDDIIVSIQESQIDLGNTTIANDLDVNLLGNSANDVNLNYYQGFRLLLQQGYKDIDNSFKISRYRSSDGVLSGSIDINETNITFTNLPVNIDTNLNVNAINAVTGTKVTVTDNLNVTGVLSTNSDKLVFGIDTNQDDRIEFNETTNEFSFYENNTLNSSIVRTGRFTSYHESAPLNEKSLRIGVASDGNFEFKNVSDDGVTATLSSRIIRSGTTTTNHQFLVNNNIQFDISDNIYTFGNDTLGSNVFIDVRTSDGRDSGIRFYNNAQIKSEFYFDDSINAIRIDRRSNIDATFLGSIAIYEDKIQTNNLPFHSPDGIFTDVIGEQTNNSGVNIDGTLIKDGGLTISSSLNSVSSLNFVCDSNNNDTTSSFIFYNNSVAGSNQIFRIFDEGSAFLYKNSGDEIFGLIDSNATSATNANQIMTFRYTSSADINSTRMGYIGYASLSNPDLYIDNESGGVRINGTSLNITTDTNNVNLNGSDLIILNNNGIYQEANGLSIKQGNGFLDYLSLESISNVYFNIDTNNSSETRVFEWRANGSNSGGTLLLSLNEDGLLDTNNNDIRLGIGRLNFASNGSDYISYDDSTNIFDFVADGSFTTSRVRSGRFYLGNDDYILHDEVTNQFQFYSDNSINSSTVRCDSINFGQDNLDAYDEGEFTPTFFENSTQVTGSTGTRQLNNVNAYYTRIGNIVTVFISNIYWGVIPTYADGGAGVYPNLSTSYSIRNLPFTAFDEAAAAITGVVNGGGDRSPNAYIADNENIIRFSDFDYGGNITLRSLTIKYRIA